jgi:hypothetical protein
MLCTCRTLPWLGVWLWCVRVCVCAHVHVQNSTLAKGVAMVCVLGGGVGWGGFLCRCV